MMATSDFRPEVEIRQTTVSVMMTRGRHHVLQNAFLVSILVSLAHGSPYIYECQLYIAIKREEHFQSAVYSDCHA